jgi:hypothetical protein
MSAGAPDLADPHWFPVDLHVPDRRFGLLRLDEDLVERAPFLDVRLDAPLADAIQVPASSIPAAGAPSAHIGWLFHTSFCASTLLARALHRSPYEITLKEPMVLRRLADARKSGWALEGLLEPSVALLGRPWHPDGAVVIKPTHVALNVAVSLMAATPTSRAVILTSPLDDFLISNLKKTPESQAKIPILADRALRATTFGTRLPPAALRPPDLVCAAGLQWAAQRELVQDVRDAVGPARIRVLDVETLLSDLPAQVWACASWLQLPVPRDRLLAHTAEIATRNAKAMAVPYGPELRAREAGMVAADHRDPLLRARAWLDAHVLPAMRDAARLG